MTITRYAFASPADPERVMITRQLAGVPDRVLGSAAIAGRLPDILATFRFDVQQPFKPERCIVGGIGLSAGLRVYWCRRDGKLSRGRGVDGGARL
jgi:hypothetical protein